MFLGQLTKSNMDCESDNSTESMLNVPIFISILWLRKRTTLFLNNILKYLAVKECDVSKFQMVQKIHIFMSICKYRIIKQMEQM